MPAVGVAASSPVLSLTGAGYHCMGPMPIITGPPTQSLFTVSGVPAVVIGDIVGGNPLPGCGGIDVSVLTVGRPKLTIGGKAVGTIGSLYTSDNMITAGNPKMFVL
jgi:uncharacterized Zn-binding protein involved in type VI secretion